MIKERDFIQNKKNTMEKLSDAIEENKVDSGIIPILEKINSYDEYYTSSSCFGRIVLLEIPKIGDKKNANSLGKWHRTIKISEFKDAFEKSENGQLWLLSQAPIIHVFSKDLEAGDKLVKKAVSCGFKNSGFRSISKNIVIEITSTERLDSPVGYDANLYCDEKYLKLLVEIANNIIKKSTSKLKKLEEKL